MVCLQGISKNKIDSRVPYEFETTTVDIPAQNFISKIPYSTIMFLNYILFTPASLNRKGKTLNGHEQQMMAIYYV